MHNSCEYEHSRKKRHVDVLARNDMSTRNENKK